MKQEVSSMILGAAVAASLLTGYGNLQQTATTAMAGNTTAAATNSTAAADAAAEAAKATTGGGKKVGVVMPTQSSECWTDDGANMKGQLEALGYEVGFQYAEDDIQMQVSQIEDMVASGVNCLVIISIDSSALINIEEQIESVDIPTTAYDRLPMNTSAISYYATFDNKGAGTVISNYIKEAKDLNITKTVGEPCTIELFTGSPDDNNALSLYNGLMEVLRPYLDDGTLIYRPGRASFEGICTLRWSQETVQQNYRNYLAGLYTDEKLDICVGAFDGFAHDCKAALEGANYKAGKDWLLIAGQDAELMAIRNIISGYQTTTVHRGTHSLTEECITIVQVILENTEPRTNNTEQYNNGKAVVPAYLYTPVVVDKDNCKETIVDGGYYAEKQLTQQR